MIASLNAKSTNREPAPAWWAVGSLVLAVLAAAPLLANPGFLNTRGGGDSPFLLFRLHQLYAALSEGVFPVRWMPDAAFGLGYPFFNYYAALPYYIAAGFRALGFSYILCLKLTQLLGFVIAAGGIHAWVQQITGRASAGFLASVAYTFAPFHLVNVYVRGDSLSEFWAMAWYPLILLAIHKAMQRPSTRRAAWVALTFGALVMTHNVSALIFAPFVAIYALGCALWLSPAGAQYPDARTAAPLRRILMLGLAGLLSLSLAAWVWLPALAERDYVQLETQTTGYFFYGGHFHAANLVQPHILFNYDIGDEATSPFSMGQAQAVLIVAGSMLLIARMIRQRAWWRDGFLLAGLLLSTWMITPLSEPVWARLPLIAFAQFPWRFLSVQALFGAAVMGALTPWAYLPPHPPLRAGEEEAWRDGHAVTYWPAAIPIGLFATLAITAVGALNLNFIPLNDADVTPQRLQWYEAFSGNIGTTIRYEYLPTWTRPRPYSSDVLLQRPPRAKFLVGGGAAERVSSGAASQVWTVRVTSPDARVAVPLLYWPGWRGEIDGQRIAVTPVEGLGYVQFDVPPGSHTIRLWLGRTGLRLWSEVASLAALLVTLVLLRPRLPRWDWMERALAAGAAVSAIAFSMMLHSLPEDEPLGGPLNADFAQEAYFHHSPEGIRYTDGTVLFVNEHDLDTLGQWPGFADWLNRIGFSSDISVALVAPPQQAQQGASSYKGPDALPLDRLTPGLYFPQVALPTVQPLTASGKTRGDLYLAPVEVADQPPNLESSPQTAETGFGPFVLTSYATADQREQLAVTFWWRSMEEATTHYAIALRLYDAAGYEWATLDTQAGSAGLYPTGLWSPGEVIPDTYWLALPPGTPPGLYMLRVTLYDAVTLAPIGQVDLTPATYDSLSPYAAHICTERVPHSFDAALGLDRASVAQTVVQGDALSVEAGWVVSAQPDQVYQAAWLLSRDGRVVWQVQTPLAPGSDPTIWIPEGCRGYVLGRHRLDVPGSLPPGDYTLTLRLLSEDGEPIGEAYTAGSVAITGRHRVFDVPPLQTALAVAFGDQLQLWGYSLSQREGALDLTVAWGALTDPVLDYKFFVHLLDPATEQIVAQTDAMPRAYAYPTSQWIDGEVVEDTITLDLRGVPPGEYRLALGWYDPATATRLTPVGVDSTDYPDGRVILPGVIRVP